MVDMPLNQTKPNQDTSSFVWEGVIPFNRGYSQCILSPTNMAANLNYGFDNYLYTIIWFEITIPI